MTHIVCIILLSASAVLQIENGWHLLAQVSIEKRYDDVLQMERDYPIFKDKLKSAEGSLIRLEGYMIPLDEMITQQSFVISSLPFQTCFFCGGAGPETVAQIKLLKPFQYTDQKIEVVGKLRLNDSDPFELYYILEEAALVD